MGPRRCNFEFLGGGSLDENGSLDFRNERGFGQLWEGGDLDLVVRMLEVAVAPERPRRKTRGI